jgi:hypothetical protein
MNSLNSFIKANNSITRKQKNINNSKFVKDICHLYNNEIISEKTFNVFIKIFLSNYIEEKFFEKYFDKFSKFDNKIQKSLNDLEEWNVKTR